MHDLFICSEVIEYIPLKCCKRIIPLTNISMGVNLLGRRRLFLHLCFGQTLTPFLEDDC